MKFFLSKSSHATIADRTRANKEYYEFNKTVLHGFPANPTCLAYDNYHKLLALGTKNGSVQIYGKPGVEFHYEFDTDVEVTKILFIHKLGQIVCLCSDYSLNLLQLSLQLDKTSVRRLLINNYFVDTEESCSDTNKRITSISINSSGSTLYIGTESGNIHLLNIKDFKLSDKIIKQELIIKAVSEELKFKPGPIEAIEEKPLDEGKILIGFSRNLIALWDCNNANIVNYFIIEQRLESLSWNNDGHKFASSHNDGSFITWDSKQESHTPVNLLQTSYTRLPYGPFPCKAITKILWQTSADGDFFIFSGGMPRASYGDKEVVSIIFKSSENTNSEKNHVLDFTSKIKDFLVISSEENIPGVLVVLVEEEIVLIDLTTPEWLQFKLPYLSCLHSSPITCSQHYSNINENIYCRIVEAGKNDCNVKYSLNEWPIKGGISKYNIPEETHDLLITGHEDGTVRFWDASTTSLKHLYTISTSKLFQSTDDDIALIDSEDNELDNSDQNEWPPFRKVGNFDPYSDDPNLAVRKISLCPNIGVLAVGGTAGQLVVFEMKDLPAELNINYTKLNIVDDKDGFVWKGHSALPVRNGKIKFSLGYQPSAVLQINPPAALTALTISTQWQVIGVGTAHGFGLFDYVTNSILAYKTTLKQSNISAVSGGDALISRRKSFKKSLRESFRRLRKGRSQKSKRNIAANPNKIQELSKLSKFDDIETKPIERQIEARTEDMMSSMVRYLYFCSATIINNTTYPTFWVGTNAGTVYIYILTGDKGSSNENVWQLAKEVQLKHKAPIIFIRLIDSNAAPIFENNSYDNEKNSLSRVLICSEEQFKLFSLPNFKTLNKFKLTAHEGARVRRLDLSLFSNKTDNKLSEYSIMCLTNQGDVSIFSPIDFKRKYQNHFIKKEDINGITSLIFTKYGEGFFLKSSSEYQRFSLSSKRINFPECFLQMPEECLKLGDETENTSEEQNVNTEINVNTTADENEPIDSHTELEVSFTASTSSNDQTHNLNNITENVIDHLSDYHDASSKEKNGIANISNPNGSITLNNNS